LPFSLFCLSLLDSIFRSVAGGFLAAVLAPEEGALAGSWTGFPVFMELPCVRALALFISTFFLPRCLFLLLYPEHSPPAPAPGPDIRDHRQPGPPRSVSLDQITFSYTSSSAAARCALGAPSPFVSAFPFLHLVSRRPFSNPSFDPSTGGQISLRYLQLLFLLG